MATRNERRKRAKLMRLSRELRIAEAAKAYEVQRIVQRNLSNPFRSGRSPKGMGNRTVYQGVTGHYGRVCGGFQHDLTTMNDRELGAFQSRFGKPKG